MVDLERMNSLLKRSKSLPEVKADTPTFLEISGYPHYENVCSNLLKFFFDPEKPHKLGTLLLESLLGEEGLNQEGVRVKREVVIDSKARIDLLISSKSHVVVIENKIYHKVNNPFDKYASYAEGQADGRAVKKFLLALKKPQRDPGHDFCVVTYGSFRAEIYKRLENYSDGHHARYRVLLHEFLDTMHNLQEGHSIMTPELLAFFCEGQDEIDKLFDSVKQFRTELRHKVSELQSLIDCSGYVNVTQTKWNTDPGAYDILVHTIQLKNGAKVVVDAKITARGWELSVTPRSATHPVRNLLTKLLIPFEDEERLILSKQSDYNEPLPNVQAELKPIIDKIARS